MPDVRNQTKVSKPTTSIRHFTDLIVWQKSFNLGGEIFALSKTWPAEERYALTDQVRRASRSVSANIAEVWGKRRYEAHFVSKLSDADAELHETENWLLYAEVHGYLETAELNCLRSKLDEIGRMLGSMMAKPGLFTLKQGAEV